MGGGPLNELLFSSFGSSIVNMGDLNNDTITDLAIGAMYNQDPGGGKSAGAFYICYMKADGTIKQLFKHSDVSPNTLSQKSGGSTIGGIDMDFMVSTY